MLLTQIESQWERIWRAAEGVKECIAGLLIDNGLHEAHAYIVEARITHPELRVFTFAVIAGTTHASVKIRATQIDHNKDDIAPFGLLVAHCLYQRLMSH